MPDDRHQEQLAFQLGHILVRKLPVQPNREITRRRWPVKFQQRQLLFELVDECLIESLLVVYVDNGNTIYLLSAGKLRFGKSRVALAQLPLALTELLLEHLEFPLNPDTEPWNL